MIVIGVDPGESTGYVVLDTRGDIIAHDTIKLWYGLDDVIEKYNPKVMVIESFMLYADKAIQQSWSSFETVEVIGVAKYLAEKNHVKIKTQPARMASSVDTALFRKLIPGSTRHEQSAMSHILVYIRNESMDEAFAEYTKFKVKKQWKIRDSGKS